MLLVALKLVLRSFKSVCEVMILIKNDINLFYLNLFFYFYIILHFRLSFNHHLPISATTSYFYFICILFYCCFCSSYIGLQHVEFDRLFQTQRNLSLHGIKLRIFCLIGEYVHHYPIESLV